MNFYRLGMYENPSVDMLMNMSRVEYAHFAALGTWVYRREPCPKCDFHWQAYAPPLLVQWEPSTTTIGDFSWDGPFGLLYIVREETAAELKRLRFPCTFHETEIVKPDRKRNVIPFPYTGPGLLWGDCTTRVHLDLEASGMEIKSSCNECGDIRYSIPDGEMVIRRKDWGGALMFTIPERGKCMTFVSDEGRHLLKDAGFTNVNFTKVGRITG